MIVLRLVTPTPTLLQSATLKPISGFVNNSEVLFGDPSSTWRGYICQYRSMYIYW